MCLAPEEWFFNGYIIDRGVGSKNVSGAMFGVPKFLVVDRYDRIYGDVEQLR